MKKKWRLISLWKKAFEELSDNKLKKAKEQQDQSSKSLKDLAESMDKLGSNGSGRQKKT